MPSLPFLCSTRRAEGACGAREWARRSASEWVRGRKRGRTAAAAARLRLHASSRHRSRASGGGLEAAGTRSSTPLPHRASAPAMLHITIRFAHIDPNPGISCGWVFTHQPFSLLSRFSSVLCIGASSASSTAHLFSSFVFSQIHLAVFILVRAPYFFECYTSSLTNYQISSLFLKLNFGNYVILLVQSSLDKRKWIQQFMTLSYHEKWITSLFYP